MNTIEMPTNENTAVPEAADELFCNFQKKALQEGFKYAFRNDHCYSIAFDRVIEYTGEANVLVLKKYLCRKF